MTSPRELVFPPLKLSRGQTTTGKILYSVNLSDRYGPAARFQLYFNPRALPTPTPVTLTVRLYGDAAPAETENTSVHLLRKWHAQPESKVRYEEHGEEPSIGSVYFPLRMLDADPPETCYLEIKYELPSRQD